MSKKISKLVALHKDKRKATIDDLHDGTIRVGVSYWMVNSPKEFKVRGRLIAGGKVGKLTIKNTESEEEYESYKQVIRIYVKEGRLYL